MAKRKCVGDFWYNDISGKVFGRLTAIRFIRPQVTKSNGGRAALWELRCECGKVIERTSNVLSGNTQSCGCLRIRDLSGLTFGRLFVTRFLGQVKNGKNSKCTLWECRCSCGSVIERPGYSLVEGNVQSCGCIRRDRKKENAPTAHRRAMVAHAKCRAKKQGLEFNLTLDDIQIPAICPLLDIPLVGGIGAPHDGNPSIDRIDSDKGYVRGNVWVISWRANRLKNDATLEELKRLVKGLEEKLPR
jgi:hypothetical protein